MSVTTATTATTARTEGTRHESASIDVIRFEGGIPGFPDRESWRVLQGDEIAPFLVLATADEQAELRVVILDPRLAFGDYVPKLKGQELRARVGASDISELLLFCVVTLSADGRAYLNLRAPILIDSTTMRGQQFILDDASIPLRAEIQQGA